jgi:NADH dehydrogenase/NADH:ubiquinone oxidoreductase subunit G
VTIAASGEVSAAASASQTATANLASDGKSNSRDAATLKQQATAVSSYVEVYDLAQSLSQIKIGHAMPKLNTVGAMLTNNDAKLASSEVSYNNASARYEAALINYESAKAAVSAGAQDLYSKPADQRTPEDMARLDELGGACNAAEAEKNAAQANFNAVDSQYNKLITDQDKATKLVNYTGIRKILKDLADREFSQQVYSAS